MKKYILLIILALLLCGCKSVKYVPVETVRIDTLYQSKVQHDSVYLHDSVQVHIKGDTVTIDRWHTKYQERIKKDTVYRAKIDSIAVPYPVEKELTKWQKMCIDYGKFTMGGTALLILLGVVWLTRKFK